jgi:hypothetical protein
VRIGLVDPACDKVNEALECERAEVLGRDGARLESRDPDMLPDKRRSHVCDDAFGIELGGCCVPTLFSCDVCRRRSIPRPVPRLASGVPWRLLF